MHRLCQLVVVLVFFTVVRSSVLFTPLVPITVSILLVVCSRTSCTANVSCRVCTMAVQCHLADIGSLLNEVAWQSQEIALVF